MGKVGGTCVCVKSTHSSAEEESLFNDTRGRFCRSLLHVVERRSSSSSSSRPCRPWGNVISVKRWWRLWRAAPAPPRGRWLVAWQAFFSVKWVDPGGEWVDGKLSESVAWGCVVHVVAIYGGTKGCYKLCGLFLKPILIMSTSINMLKKDFPIYCSTIFFYFSTYRSCLLRQNCFL